uniref:Uncharacterized protein n=1 Tax=Rhizophora mucronata TaxID=61149 RepID=A0A2P2QZF1_RHIMU
MIFLSYLWQHLYLFLYLPKEANNLTYLPVSNAA